jgi:hypothetical protein
MYTPFLFFSQAFFIVFLCTCVTPQNNLNSPTPVGNIDMLRIYRLQKNERIVETFFAERNEILPRISAKKHPHPSIAYYRQVVIVNIEKSLFFELLYSIFCDACRARTEFGTEKPNGRRAGPHDKKIHSVSKMHE